MFTIVASPNNLLQFFSNSGFFKLTKFLNYFPDVCNKKWNAGFKQLWNGIPGKEGSIGKRIKLSYTRS